MDPSSVRSFYKGKHVFITGATGFIGKSVVEKILRSCPEVNTIYILVRQKKSVSTVNNQSRLDQLVENPVFETLKNKDPECLKKIRAVTGDIQSPLLGINESDRIELISKVSVVIHSAATITFDDPLQHYLEVNVNGLQKVIQLCKEMKQLKALVHVSTAYSNCNQSVVEEKIYAPPVGTEEVLKHLNDLSGISGDVEAEAKKCRPNYYVYSKAIAEHLVSLEASNLPVCVVRPSIVTPALQEPFAGWVDQWSGPTAMCVGHSLGAIRVIKGDTKTTINWIPVDVVANLIICAAWATSSSSTQLKVYNCCATKENPMLGRVMRQLQEDNARKYTPYCKALYYPSVTLTRYDFICKLRSFLFEWIPAAMYDTFLKNDKLSALRLHKKFQKVRQLTEYFYNNEWEFKTGNVEQLCKSLDQECQQIFFFNMNHVSWREYSRIYSLGIRRHMLKEEDSTLPEAKEHISRLFKIYCFVNAAQLAVTSLVVFTMGKLSMNLLREYF